MSPSQSSTRPRYTRKKFPPSHQIKAKESAQAPCKSCVCPTGKESRASSFRFPRKLRPSTLSIDDNDLKFFSQAGTTKSKPASICKRWLTMRAQTSRHSGSNPTPDYPEFDPEHRISLTIPHGGQRPRKPVLPGCYHLPGFVSTASAAESFRSRCGSVRKAPVCSSQAFLAGCTTSRTRYG
jgi:hypothetical protein